MKTSRKMIGRLRLSLASSPIQGDNPVHKSPKFRRTLQRSGAPLSKVPKAAVFAWLTGSQP
jgi:hypothetical protein